ncbi:MAG: right-handed parallel beta-helix repeat-containing protein [Armatimonadetes bacterium]|nr:right-handed parallel beta-helix repeat-containing protein [Armatimonadota bacterium]
MFVLPILCALAPPAAPAPPRAWNVATSAQLAAAASRIGRLGGTIRLAPGDYTLTKPVTFRNSNHIVLQGSGWNTTIRFVGAGDALTYQDCAFCFVRDVLIDGGGKAASGIVFRGKGSSSNTVDQCRISSFVVSGIRFEGDPASPQSSNTVSRCHLIGNLKEQLYSRYNNDFYIIRNQFGTHGKYPDVGAYLSNSSAGSYTLNYHWGNGVAFRMAGGSHFNRIENNRFENSRAEGVVLGDETPWACMFTIFTGNTVHTNSEGAPGKHAAMTATNVHDCTFTSNQVFSWDATHVKHLHSLVLGAGCRNWIVKDNILRANEAAALVYPEGQGHIVKDNLTD